MIGARYYDAGGPSPTANPGEFLSPRDYDGHGSHTASTAAGDHGVNATINGADVGDARGMAPGARIAIYKVAVENAPTRTASGSTADIVAAIDARGHRRRRRHQLLGRRQRRHLRRRVELAFLNAAAAGVFVAAAAGNAGPGASHGRQRDAVGDHRRRGHPRPSLREVTVTLGNGATYTGVGVGAGRRRAHRSSTRPTSASPAARRAADAEHLASDPASLDPAKVAGKIVLCERGTNARDDKSLAVKDAGGVGMILCNAVAELAQRRLPLRADGPRRRHRPARRSRRTSPARADPTASLRRRSRCTARGAGGGRVLLARPVARRRRRPAQAGHHRAGRRRRRGGLAGEPQRQPYDAESGTSMSSPHIAGIAALMMQQAPGLVADGGQVGAR